MMDRVHFKGFKSLHDVTLDLGRFTVLVGPNGCGKSSVLQGIDMLSKACRPGQFALAFERVSPPRLVTRGSVSISLIAVRGDDEVTLSIGAGASAKDPLHGGARVSSKRGQHPFVTMQGDTSHEEMKRTAAFGHAVDLHLDATRMTATSVADEEEPSMAPDGGGLASSLAWIAGAAPEILEQIARDLARVVPGVAKIRTFREKVTDHTMEPIVIDGQSILRPRVQSRIGDRFAIDFDGTAGPVPADLLSEGTVLALGLLTKLREPSRPKMLLLDDIDRGLHIEAQAKLVGVLRDLLALDPELQIVCTTHSPYLLDRFEPAEVRVLALDEQRHTRACALTEHPDFETWKFGTQTGELWAALGHAWVTARRGAGGDK